MLMSIHYFTILFLYCLFRTFFSVSFLLRESGFEIIDEQALGKAVGFVGSIDGRVALFDRLESDYIGCD